MLPLTYHRCYPEEADYYFRWYEARQSGIGKAFLDELGMTLAKRGSSG